MFSKYNKEFKEILSLALLKEIAYNQEAKDGIHNFDLSDMIDYLEKSKNLKSKKLNDELNKIMSSLDDEAILNLQAVMYLGRDYNAEDGTALQAYSFLLKHLDSLGNNKSVMIDMMLSKVPFGTYLKKGFYLLNVRL